MWKDDLMKEYEEIVIRLAICSAMEIEGNELIKRMEDTELPEPSLEKVHTDLEKIYEAYNKRYGSEEIVTGRTVL